MERLSAKYFGQGYVMVANNSDPGDDNAAYVKPYFQSPPPPATGPFDHLYNIYANAFGSFWQPMGASGAIPYHVLLDKDGYCRNSWLGGHGDNCDQFYEPYVKNLMGLP